MHCRTQKRFSLCGGSSRNPVTDLRCRGAISEFLFSPGGVEKSDILQKIKSLSWVMLIFKSATNQSAEWGKKKKIPCLRWDLARRGWGGGGVVSALWWIFSCWHLCGELRMRVGWCQVGVKSITEHEGNRGVLRSRGDYEEMGTAMEKDISISPTADTEELVKSGDAWV